MVDNEPLRIAVLIDHRPNSFNEVGGLVGTWEQLAHIAGSRTDLELTLFFLGESSQTRMRKEHVRYRFLPPVLGTQGCRFLSGLPTHTDLAPFHPTLFRQLRGFDLYHTTDTISAFAKTALWKARLSRVPLVTSVQTDIIAWARIYAPEVLRQLLPGRTLRRWLLERYHYLERRERAMVRRFGRYVRQCRAVLVSHPRDRQRVQTLAPTTPAFWLRRGIDLQLFHPRQRDRQYLQDRFGIPPECTLLLFVGRLDHVKGILVAAHAVHQLLQQGCQVHLLVAGDGILRQDVARLLGAHVTLVGNLPHHALPRLYASADLFLFPSEAEVWPNVVVEALACGLPVLACAQGAGHLMQGRFCEGLLLPNRLPDVWSVAIAALLAQPDRLQAMRRKARLAVETRVPSWTQVLEEDLLPVWHQVVHRTSCPPARA